MFLELVADCFLDLLPLHAEGRVGQHVFEQLAVQAILAERVAKNDVADVLAADQHVGLADRLRLGVQFLTEQREPGFGIQLEQILTGHAEHAAGAGSRVIQGAHHAGFDQRIAVFDRQQIHHQANHLTRGEVLAGRFVGEFRELADQFFEHQAHLQVVDFIRVQPEAGKLLGDQVQEFGLVQPLHRGREIEMLEDQTHIRRKTQDGIRIGTSDPTKEKGPTAFACKSLIFLAGRLGFEPR